MSDSHSEFKYKVERPSVSMFPIKVLCYDEAHTYHLISANPNLKAKVPLNILEFLKMDENGEYVPGVTTEQVIAVLIDRLSKLDAKFPCNENKAAIESLENAFYWLETRTKNRQNRNVEGQHTN